MMYIQLKYSHVLNQITKAYNKIFPIKNYKTGYKNQKPWLTAALIKSIQHENK